MPLPVETALHLPWSLWVALGILGAIGLWSWWRRRHRVRPTHTEIKSLLRR